MKKALIFYSRVPDEHIVGKTRIGKAIHNQELANELARSLILDILEYYMKYDSKEYDLHFYHQGHKGKFGLKNKFKLRYYHPTMEAGLGENMKTIFKTQLSVYKKVIIVGSDIPLLDIKMIKKAFRSLTLSDVVTVPVEDNGYCLIGLKQPHDLFSNVSTFASRTAGYHLMNETRELARQRKLRFKELDCIFDIDEPQDLFKLWLIIQKNGKLLSRYSHLSHTFAFLKQNALTFNLPGSKNE